MSICCLFNGITQASGLAPEEAAETLFFCYHIGANTVLTNIRQQENSLPDNA